MNNWFTILQVLGSNNIYNPFLKCNFFGKLCNHSAHQFKSLFLN